MRRRSKSGRRRTPSSPSYSTGATLLAWLAKRLTERMCYDPSYVGKVESGGARPTEDFAKRADQTLNAGGAIVRRWKEYDLAARWAVRQDHHVDEPMPSSRCRSATLAWVVEHDHAELRYADGRCHPTQRRRLRNVGSEPVTLGTGSNGTSAPAAARSRRR